MHSSAGKKKKIRNKRRNQKSLKIQIVRLQRSHLKNTNIQGWSPVRPNKTRLNYEPSAMASRDFLKKDISEMWITDSGASKHITFRRDWLVNMKSVSSETVSLGDEGVCEVRGIGTVEIIKWANGDWSKTKRTCFPSTSLFSVGVLDKKDFKVIFESGSAVVTCDDKVITCGIC